MYTLDPIYDFIILFSCHTSLEYRYWFGSHAGAFWPCIQLDTTEDIWFGIWLWSSHVPPMVDVANQFPCKFLWATAAVSTQWDDWAATTLHFFFRFPERVPSVSSSRSSSDYSFNLWIVKNKFCYQTRDMTVHARSVTLGPQGRGWSDLGLPGLLTTLSIQNYKKSCRAVGTALSPVLPLPWVPLKILLIFVIMTLVLLLTLAIMPHCWELLYEVDYSAVVHRAKQWSYLLVANRTRLHSGEMQTCTHIFD